MENLIPKKYKISLIIDKKILFYRYERKIELRFEEAKMRDVFDYMESIEWDRENVIIWLLDFVEKYSVTKLKKSDREYIMQYPDRILPTIRETYFEWCFSERKEWSWDTIQAPYTSYLMALSEKIWLDPITILKSYTSKQLSSITDWAVWNANEATKEWQQKNKLQSIKRKAEQRTPEEWEKIKETIASLP